MKWIEASIGLGGRTVWYNGDSSYVSGWLILEGRVIKGADLVAVVDELDTLENFEVEAGEYTLVKVLSRGVELKSDSIASIPIFFANDGQEILVSPDPHSIKNLLGENESRLLRDQLATFLCCGMSLGRNSIRDGIYRVQANETLRLADQKMDVIPRSSIKLSPEHDYESAKKEGRELLEQSISQMIGSLGDRDIWIPLSGGMDSRLLACLLKNMSSNSISCFSYGRRDSFESERSEAVAKELGLDWHFVEYSPKKWKKWWEDERYQDYRMWAYLLTAIEHEQDWPAVLGLKESGVLNTDAVFVPGHSMDFLAGSHLPQSEPEDLVQFILDKYFNLWPYQEMGGDIEELLKTSLSDLIGNRNQNWLELFDRFGLKERQSKMIANSVRVYEHHGYEWRLPYWDADLVEFFLNLPLEWRLGKKLYLDICEELLPSSLMEMPFRPPDLGRLENKWTRLTDRNFSRQSMFSKSKVLRSIPSQRIETEIDGLPEDIKEWFEPIGRNPLVSIPFNGQLSLYQVLDQFKKESSEG